MGGHIPMHTPQSPLFNPKAVCKGDSEILSKNTVQIMAEMPNSAGRELLLRHAREISAFVTSAV